MTRCASFTHHTETTVIKAVLELVFLFWFYSRKLCILYILAKDAVSMQQNVFFCGVIYLQSRTILPPATKVNDGEMSI